MGNLNSPEEAIKAKNTIAKKTCIVIRCNRSRAQEKDVRKKLEWKFNFNNKMGRTLKPDDTIEFAYGTIKLI